MSNFSHKSPILCYLQKKINFLTKENCHFKWTGYFDRILTWNSGLVGFTGVKLKKTLHSLGVAVDHCHEKIEHHFRLHSVDNYVKDFTVVNINTCTHALQKSFEICAASKWKFKICLNKNTRTKPLQNSSYYKLTSQPS